MSTNKSSSTSNDLKSALTGLKGAGDAIRGTAMEAVDSLSHNSASKQSEAKHHALAEKGAAEAKAADQRFGERRAERNPGFADASGRAGGGDGVGNVGHHHQGGGAGVGGVPQQQQQGGYRNDAAGVAPGGGIVGHGGQQQQHVGGGQVGGGAGDQGFVGDNASGVPTGAGGNNSSIVNSKIARSGH